MRNIVSDRIPVADQPFTKVMMVEKGNICTSGSSTKIPTAPLFISSPSPPLCSSMVNRLRQATSEDNPQLRMPCFSSPELLIAVFCFFITRIGQQTRPVDGAGGSRAQQRHQKGHFFPFFFVILPTYSLPRDEFVGLKEQSILPACLRNDYRVSDFMSTHGTYP